MVNVVYAKVRLRTRVFALIFSITLLLGVLDWNYGLWHDSSWGHVVGAPLDRMVADVTSTSTLREIHANTASLSANQGVEPKSRENNVDTALLRANRDVEPCAQYLQPYTQSHLVSGEWQKHIDLVNHSNYFVVNIGARDGKQMDDPCAFWLTRPNAVGLAVEGDGVFLAALRKNYPSSEVSKHIEFLTPRIVHDVFKNAGVPDEPLLMKVDIDSYDVDLTDEILSRGYEPQFIVVEHNEKFPPGFFFKIRYHPDRQWTWKYDHIFGNSVDAWNEMFQKYPNYVLLGIFFNQMIYANRRQVKQSSTVSLQCAYVQGYMEMEKKPAYNRNVADWINEKISYEKRLDSMRLYLNSSKTRHAVGFEYPIELRLTSRKPIPMKGSCLDSKCADRITLKTVRTESWWSSFFNFLMIFNYL